MTRTQVIQLLVEARRIVHTGSRDLSKGASAKAGLESVEAALELLRKAQAELYKESERVASAHRLSDTEQLGQEAVAPVA